MFRDSYVTAVKPNVLIRLDHSVNYARRCSVYNAKIPVLRYRKSSSLHDVRSFKFALSSLMNDSVP